MKKQLHFKLPEFLLVVLVLISGVSLGFSSHGFIINFQKVGFTVMSTIQKGVHTVVSGVTGFATAIHDMTVLQKEYKELTERLEDYEYLQRTNTEIRKENERLREQLGFAENLSYKNVAAQIIGRDPDAMYSGITINKGARSGIKKGMPVIAVQNGNVGIVGKVVTVGLGTSMVMPLYDPQCNISSRLQNTRDIGIVSGNGIDSDLSMSYIRKRLASEINRGDIVVTSGENDNYMKDIPVGRITQVRILDYDSSLDIDVEPIIDFSRLETVLVVNQNEQNDRVPAGEGSSK